MLRNILRRLHAKEIAVALVALLTISILPLPAQASSVTEFYPTSTAVIIAGWNDPTEVYVSDTVYASSTTDNAEQEYSGFGFNFNSTDIIEKVYISIKMTVGLSIEILTTEGQFIGYVKYYDYDAIPIPLKWRLKKVCSYDCYTLLGLDSAGNFQLDLGVPFLFDITNIITDYLHVNNLKFRLKSDLISGDAFLWEVDVLSVVVAYSTTIESELPIGLAVGGLFAGFIGVMVLAIKKRR